MIKAYIRIARPDHWFKNIFMLPGIALALLLDKTTLSTTIFIQVLLAIAATCLIASANYTINEWLDAATDKFHPVKRDRPSVVGEITAFGTYLQWSVLAALGIAIGAQINTPFIVYSACLLVMGALYNVKPFRTKDRIYLDVLSESVNNPLRFILGWTAITTSIIPPSSILFIYWMGGAYLMAIKRYSEYRYIGNPQVAGKYRRSFKYYTEHSLLLSAFFYALTAAFFSGVFLIKYRVEYIIAIPLLALMLVWYLWLGMQANSVTQNPEQLYKEKGFIAFLAITISVILVLSFVDIPWLNILLEVRYR